MTKSSLETVKSLKIAYFSSCFAILNIEKIFPQLDQILFGKRRAKAMRFSENLIWSSTLKIPTTSFPNYKGEKWTNILMCKRTLLAHSALSLCKGASTVLPHDNFGIKMKNIYGFCFGKQGENNSTLFSECFESSLCLLSEWKWKQCINNVFLVNKVKTTQTCFQIV